jgi:hypothetical protein
MMTCVCLDRRVAGATQIGFFYGQVSTPNISEYSIGDLKVCVRHPMQIVFQVRKPGIICIERNYIRLLMDTKRVSKFKLLHCGLVVAGQNYRAGITHSS